MTGHQPGIKTWKGEKGIFRPATGVSAWYWFWYSASRHLGNHPTHWPRNWNYWYVGRFNNFLTHIRRKRTLFPTIFYLCEFSKHWFSVWDSLCANHVHVGNVPSFDCAGKKSVGLCRNPCQDCGKVAGCKGRNPKRTGGKWTCDVAWDPWSFSFSISTLSYYKQFWWSDAMIIFLMCDNLSEYPCSLTKRVEIPCNSVFVKMDSRHHDEPVLK